MKKIIIAALLIAVFIPGVAFAGNIIANGEIAIAATATPSTNTQANGMYTTTQDFSEVLGIRVLNNTATTVVTTVTCTDLDGSTTLGSITTNTTGETSFIATYTTGAPPVAKTVSVSCVIPTNATASTVQYWIYGR